MLIQKIRHIRNYVSPNFGYWSYHFGNRPNQATSSNQSVRHPPECDCRELFDHVKYFDHLVNYKRSTVIAKFRKFVKKWLIDDSTRLLDSFDSWKRSDEAKQYWRERVGVTGETVVTTTTTATDISSTEESAILDEVAHANFTLPDNHLLLMVSMTLPASTASRTMLARR